MKKTEKMVGRSQEQKEWGEEIRNAFIRNLSSIRSNEEHSEDDRELAWHALLAIPYVSNIASRWIDDYAGNPDKKSVVQSMADYALYLVNSEGFVNGVARTLEEQGLEEEYAEVIRSKKGSIVVLLVDEDVEMARRVASAVIEQRIAEQERIRNNSTRGERFFDSEVEEVRP